MSTARMTGDKTITQNARRTSRIMDCIHSQSSRYIFHFPRNTNHPRMFRNLMKSLKIKQPLFLTGGQ